MSNIFGGSNKNPATAFQLHGGGTGAPWNFGVSEFDQSQIGDAVTSNKAAIGNRYDQLGLGGSSMEQEDQSMAGTIGDAMTGQLQTQNEANPALNPALQPQLNQLIGSIGSTQGSSLSNLATAVGLGGDAFKLAGDLLPLIGL